jgi:hypothetical protein
MVESVAFSSRFFVAITLLAGVAHAEELRLSWVAEEGCASREGIEAGLESVLGRAISELSSTWAKVEASAKRQGEAWELRVLVVGRDGSVNERRLSVASCAEAGDAAIAVLATSLTGKLAAEPTLEERAPERPFVPLVSARPEPPRSRRTRQREQQRVEPLTPFRAAANFGFDTSALGSVAPLLELRLGLEGERFGVYGFGDVLRTQTMMLEGGFAELGLWTSGVLACYRWLGRRGPAALSSRFCAGGELGRMTAAGGEFSGAREESATWAAARVEADLELGLSRQVSLRAAASGIAQARTLYVAVAPERVYETPAVTGRALLGLEAAF